MNHSGITERLLKFSSALLGHIKGGLSHVNIVASMIFSGVSGSAVADTSAVGSVLIPAMKKEGYHSAYAAAVTAASSTIGPIIPPSIPFVIFGLLANASIGDLFLAGVVPGLLMGVFLLISSYIISLRRNYPANARASLKILAKSFLDAFLALLMPIIIVGGITTGIVTPTEAGVVAVVYAILIGLFVYKGFKIWELPRILKDSMLNSGLILIIIATTGLFSYLVADMRAGELLAKFFTSISSEKWVILTMIVVFFIIWGCILDPITALVVLVPLLIPVTNAIGIDTIHFGVIIVLTLMIGLVTPPVGIVLYLGAALAKCSFEEVVKESALFLVALFLVLAICTYLEGVVLWLPRYLAG
jgi:tripartite ATP-independent transporter DctM subunit